MNDSTITLRLPADARLIVERHQRSLRKREGLAVSLTQAAAHLLTLGRDRYRDERAAAEANE